MILGAHCPKFDGQKLDLIISVSFYVNIYKYLFRDNTSITHSHYISNIIIVNQRPRQHAPVGPTWVWLGLGWAKMS